jgi:Flp pilus assembly protein TadD
MSRTSAIKSTERDRPRRSGTERAPPLRIAVSFPAPGRPVACPIHVLSAVEAVEKLLSSGSIPLGPSVLLVLLFAVATATAQPAASQPGASNSLSLLIEAAGKVEYFTPQQTNWRPAVVGLSLKPGDRVRTLAESRAAVQLSDRSVIRLSERTTLEILPARHAEKRRFGLPGGSLFFFNREKPADVEFDTPLAAGAIRGTEFLLETADTGTSVRLALLDGLVTLTTRTGELSAKRGEEVRLRAGQPPQTSALVNAVSPIQWALYYPAVVVPDDLQLTRDETGALNQVLEHYRAGDLLAALAAWPSAVLTSARGPAGLRAALELAVGRVNEAEQLLAASSRDSPAVIALHELITTIRGEHVSTNAWPRTASELMARSYTLQARADLGGALSAARVATALAPAFGLAHARLAELEFSFGRRRAALAELDQALRLSPQFAPAHALRGFVLLEQADTGAALAEFDRARELDAAFGPAWLGRGLCLMREREFGAARAAFQAAAALEPQRGVFRAYLGKAASEMGDPRAAEKEFALAKRLDPNDPTGWLYSALHLWQQNRLNEAIRDLERSEDLNDERARFRSRLLLDEDRSVRSANLAALYSEAGFPDVSRHTAARSVAEDYANFSGHLFLANSYQALEDVNRFDLRLETARQSELLVANLLAPPGAGNLSQQLSQQEHLLFFDPRPLGLSSLTEYASGGDWHHADTLFGSLDRFSYAFDASYESFKPQHGTNGTERQEFALTLKQGVTAEDEFYFQVGGMASRAGDVAAYYDPAQAKLGFHVTETQEPTLYAGWHHAWSPGSHTLLLTGRLDDHLTFHDPKPNLLFLVQENGVTTGVSTPPFMTLDFASDFTLYSAELQQIWENERQLLVLGGRWQSGDIDTEATIKDFFGTTFKHQHLGTSLERGDVYGYYSWRIFQPLQVIGGVSYDHLSFPQNTDLPPISTAESTRELVSPKAGLLFTPWTRGLLRADYTRSLGGLFFDNSVRLEPAQIAGFNQAFRSLVPESVAGLVPGTEFETAGVGFDQSFAHGTWFGVEAEWLTSSGERAVGALTNSTFIPIPDPNSQASTREVLNFRERDLSAYAAQLLGDWFAVSARYRLSESHLGERFPQIPDAAQNLGLLEQDKRATLHQVSLGANFQHPSGFFAQWESAWYYQHNAGSDASLHDADFWQHNVWAGYRFARRYAELRLGVLDLFDRDYRLNPLNLHSQLPRARTFVASLRLNF